MYVCTRVRRTCGRTCLHNGSISLILECEINQEFWGCVVASSHLTGVSDDALEEADDAADTKAALIGLLLSVQQQQQEEEEVRR